MPTKTKRDAHFGRPIKPNKDEFLQVTCVLRRDTVERMREGAGSKHFGAYLQAHLDRYPPPTRAVYLELLVPSGLPVVRRRPKKVNWDAWDGISNTDWKELMRALRPRKVAAR